MVIDSRSQTLDRPRTRIRPLFDRPALDRVDSRLTPAEWHAATRGPPALDVCPWTLSAFYLRSAPFWVEPIAALDWLYGVVWLSVGSTSSFYPHGLELSLKFGHKNPSHPSSISLRGVARDMPHRLLVYI